MTTTTGVRPSAWWFITASAWSACSSTWSMKEPPPGTGWPPSLEALSPAPLYTRSIPTLIGVTVAVQLAAFAVLPAALTAHHRQMRT